MRQHAPGPWSVGEEHESKAEILCSRGRVATAVNTRPLEMDCAANARLIAAAPDLDAAAALAITALAFAQERYQRDGDELALAQTSHAKAALIAAQNKARGREPQMRDVTPSRKAISGAVCFTLALSIIANLIAIYTVI